MFSSYRKIESVDFLLYDVLESVTPPLYGGLSSPVTVWNFKDIFIKFNSNSIKFGKKVVFIKNYKLWLEEKYRFQRQKIV